MDGIICKRINDCISILEEDVLEALSDDERYYAEDALRLLNELLDADAAEDTDFMCDIPHQDQGMFP